MKVNPIILAIGHILLLIGCYSFTLGLYLLPQSNPTPLDVLSKPLFWGLVCILGGICTIRNSFPKDTVKK
ncbi:hypothetical protein H5T87_08280 [bacterium]|nr:hypothetical protein [bacterium]